MNFYLDRKILYKRSFDGTLFRCLNENEIGQALKKVRVGICASHSNSHTMAMQMQKVVQRDRLTMERDRADYVRKCYKCHTYGDKINGSLASLFNMTVPYSFDIWGLDVIGPINLKTSNEHKFILVTINYFIKWVEANSYAYITQKVVKRFVEKDLIYLYGLPTRLVIDNIQNFNGKFIAKLCTK